MKILIVEPFFGGSHRQWAEGFQRHSTHEVDILSMKAHNWKWRMYGGAVTLARLFMERLEMPDLILASDMLDLTTFLALTRTRTANIPTVIYFHENQLTYPWSPNGEDVKKERNHHYSFMNYTSALAADGIFFNSFYHKNSFTNALTPFLKMFPDKRELGNVALIKAKSEVLHLGLDLARMKAYQHTEKSEKPLILWNHRWEYDKNPVEFFETLFQLKSENIAFELVVLGSNNHKYPPIFDEAKERLSSEIVAWRFLERFEEYAYWLWKSDILFVTGNQDFFGGSVVEAMYCECFPILPNRLAYPEHIETSFQGDYFYNNKEEMIDLLRKTVLNIKATRSASNYRNIVANYDWNNLIESYDQRLKLF